MKIVIVGGVAGGATAAVRARRLDESATIVMFERGADVSFANCGMPYFIGGEIQRPEALVLQTRQALADRFKLDVRTKHEALRVDRQRKVVLVRDLSSGAEFEESYDVLILSPGAAPIVPDTPGVTSARVFVLRNLEDTHRIKAAVTAGAKRAVVIGGGFIGLEMAENLQRRGLEVSLVELGAQVMPPVDFEIAARIQAELKQHGVALYLNTSAERFEDTETHLEVVLRGGDRLSADLVVLAIGVRPESKLAQEAGLTLSERGAVSVDAQMRSSDPNIYAVGDVVQVNDPVLGGPSFVPLAGPANRQARTAVDSIYGRAASFRGTFGTSIVRVFGLTVASTGATEKVLKRRNVPYLKVYVHRGQHVGYFPGSQPMMIKLLFAPESGKVLGAQIVGGEGVDKRIDVIATSLYAGLSVFDLENLELAYAPQYGAAKDPINIAGNVASNLLRGDESFVYAEDLDAESRRKWTVLDVREVAEHTAARIPGALHIPLNSLRTRLSEIPKDKPLAVHCAVGQRAYYATRILRAAGFQVFNVAGGMSTWLLVRPNEVERG